MALKPKLVKSLIQRQEFSYTKDKIALNFTLRVDNSSELRLFKECLEEALNDVNNILKGMKN